MKKPFGFPLGPLAKEQALRPSRDVSALVQRVQGATEVEALVKRVTDIPWSPINQGGGFRELALDLSTSDPLHRFNGRAYGASYILEGSAPGGRLNLDFGGGGLLTNVPPGTDVPAHFDQLLVNIGSRSVVNGFARLVIYTNPLAALFRQPLTLPGPLAPVYLLGSATAFSLLQGENSRPPTISIPYATQTGNFTVGLTVTGGTSGATGVISTDNDAGTTGTLMLSNVVGTFVTAEVLTDSGTGSATSSAGPTTLTGATTTNAFLVTGWKKLAVLVDTLSASANATSFNLSPWFLDSDLAVWADDAIELIAVPDSTTTAQRYRTFTLDLTGLRGYLYFQIDSLLAAARTGLAFKVLGVA